MKKIILSIIFSAVLLANPLLNPAFAQLRTDSGAVTTKVGNPASSSSTIASAALDLATTVSGACSGKLQGGNTSCLQGITFTNVSYPDGAVQQLLNSARAYYCDDAHPEMGTCLQCVGFVQAAVMGATGSILNNGGNAKDYATNVPTGYQYYALSSGTPIEEGDIIIKTDNGYGHIAVVVQVMSPTAVKVAEGNYDTWGAVGINNTATALWAGFLRKL